MEKFSNCRYHFRWSGVSVNDTTRFAAIENPLFGAKKQEHRSPVIANFLLKFSNFRCHGNRGWSETNFKKKLSYCLETGRQQSVLFS